MTHLRFDVLTRILARFLDRREGLSVLALVLAAVLTRNDALARKLAGTEGSKKKRTRKRKNKQHKKKKKRRGGGGARDCTSIPLEPGADLHECDLREHPDLANADFTDALLEDSNLSGAALTGVSFRGARLWRAKLVGTDLTNAAFDDSSAGRTDVYGVDFTDADLTGVDGVEDALYFRYAVLCGTTMPNGDVDDSGCP
jgi:uncharacterized protein YjbI with pentapeptide repeats